MRFRLSRLAALAVTGLCLLAAGCGDGSGAKSAPTVKPTVAARTPGSSTIPAPKLPSGNVEAIRPAHGASVTQAATRTVNADRPNGICAQVNFKDLPENGQWFRMVVDGKEVTGGGEITWVVPANAQTEAPPGGTMCYAPKEGLPAGKHQVALGVQNPRNAAEPTRQIVEWEFEVTP